nr:ATP sulfurylase [Salmonella sp. NCTC 7297]
MNTTLAQQIAHEGGVEAWMTAQQHKSLLRFLTCGSVDDGKSTLIGRLLHDTRQIYEDQLSSLHNDSKRHGTQGEKLDLALLVDGLQPSVSRALPLTSRTAISPLKNENLLSPIRRGMNNIPVIWRPGRPPAIWRSC